MTTHELETLIRPRLSRRVRDVPQSGIRQFFDVLNAMPDVISLGVGEPDFDTPERIVEAGVRSLRSGRTHYSSNFGTLELREALSGHLAKLYGVTYDPEREIVMTIGASEALAAALAATVDSGDEVVLAEPSYVAYVPGVIFSGGVPVFVRTRPEDDWQLDPDAVQAAITPRTKVLFLGYPSNPTGAVLTADTIRALAEIAERHDLLVISDEIYGRLVYGGHRHEMFSALPAMRDRSIVLGGFSKAYAMTGWRIGYAVAPPDLLDGIMKVHQYSIMSASTTAQDAAVVALVRGEEDVERMVAEYDRRRRMFVSGLESLGLATAEPKGAFYAFPSVASTGLSSEDFSRRLPLRAQGRGHPWRGVRPDRRGLRSRLVGDRVRGSRRGTRSHRRTHRRPGVSTSVAAPVMYEPVIGIECHVQLKTVSKMFCGCANVAHEAEPNSVTCPVCLGLPGAMPVLNREAVRHVLATGIAIGASIPETTRWDRKNYFYPDLPKGYQISQYELPLASAGYLTVETSGGPRTVGITRAHLEEDTARSQHTREGSRAISLLDYDRSGAPLMEIVTDPVIHDAETARRYAEELRLLLVTIGVSDAAMESGQMRVEANVSLRPVGTQAFGTRVEVKNMNSFRSVERAIEHEIARQTAVLQRGEGLTLETRGWDDDRAITYHMRAKETSDDYRYFPEPDLPPLRIDADWLEEIRASLPELPSSRRARYRDDLGLSAYDADVLVGDAAAAAMFERVQRADAALPPKKVANWVTGEYLRLAKSDPEGSDRSRIDPSELAALIRRVEDGELSGTNAKEVFERHAADGRPVAEIVAEAGFAQISDVGSLQAAIDEVLAENPDAVADIAAGKHQALGFLTGKVMKKTRGQANAGVVGAMLRESLGVES